MTTTQSLEYLVTTLEYKGMSIKSHLRPAVPREQIQIMMRRIGLTPPGELYDLYTWHDGIDDLNASTLLFGEHQFLSLHSAIEEYQEYSTHYDPTGLPIDLAQCFPFASFQGSYLTIYCDPRMVDGLVHPIIEVYHDIGSVFETINSMAQTVAAWYAAGVYDREPVNEELRMAIRQHLNPRLSFGE